MDDVVNTRHGQVRGGRVDGIHTFKGIPYAAPPFGANRLRPPRPLEAWSDVRDALTYGPTPSQLTLPPPFDVIAPSVPGEDCLNLNIWSSDLGSAGQPVMVWIPGGAFEAGGAVAYDGSRFARDGLVCVTINYRVGADGFLALATGSPTSAYSTRSPPWSGFRRTSPPSAVIPETSRSSESRQVR